MSLESKVLKGASWLALFKLLSQVLSWVVTIIVARILIPEDYGLMEKATILTGYAAMFSELGLGAAIIQRPMVNHKQLSSIFWFTFFISIFMVFVCFALAIPTAMIFNDTNVIPITRAVSIIFVLGGLQIVPLNLLKKELKFKKVGFIEMTSVAISCLSMLLIANLGGGVWTLIGGHIIRDFTRVVLVILITKWFPLFHFELKEAIHFLKFGVIVSVGQSLFYVYDKSDRFFAGRAWGTDLLGLYSLALTLARMPTEKIVVLINQVSYSALSQLQHDMVAFKSFYLKIIKVTVLIVLPIFIGLYCVGEEFITLFLNEKWHGIIPVFKLLCVSQIFTALNAINNFVHNALGKPRTSLYYNVLITLFMPISFYIFTQHGFKAILIPWLTIYPALSLIWIIFTTSRIELTFMQYLKNISSPLLSVGIMFSAITLFDMTSIQIMTPKATMIFSLAGKIVIGILIYIASIWILDREAIEQIKNLNKKKL